MKSTISIFAILILVLNTISAQTFEKILRTINDEVVYDASIYDENHVIFPYNYGQNGGNFHAKVYKMNINSGIITDSVNIIFNNYDEYDLEAIYQILPYQDSLHICLGKAINKSTDDNQLFICHINNDLEQTFSALAGDPEKQDYIYDFIINSNNNIITAGTEFIDDKSFNIQNKIINPDKDTELTPEYKLLLTEKTIWGEEIKRTIIDGINGLGLSIIEIPNKGLYHFHFSGDGHKYLTVDTANFNIVSIQEYPLGFSPRMAFNGNSDTSSYIVGRQTYYSGNTNEHLSFMELDTLGIIKSHHTYEHDSDIFYSYKTFNVGTDHIYVGTTIPFTYSPPLLYPEPRFILMYKLGLNGEIIWQKYYKGEVNYMPYRIMGTPDGGALIFSTKYDWNDIYPMQADVHILKIDSDGNYIPVGMEEPISNQKQILVWPNPAKNHVNFTFGLLKDLQIDIFDINGRLVFSDFFHQSSVIDLSGFSSGLYVYSISDEDGFLERGKLMVE